MFDSRMDEAVRQYDSAKKNGSLEAVKHTEMRHIENFVQIIMNMLFLWHNVPSLVNIPIQLQTST